MILRANVDCSGMGICCASCAVNSSLGDTKNDGVFCGGSHFPFSLLLPGKNMLYD